jgi:hypothetical protein
MQMRDCPEKIGFKERLLNGQSLFICAGPHRKFIPFGARGPRKKQETKKPSPTRLMGKCVLLYKKCSAYDRTPAERKMSCKECTEQTGDENCFSSGSRHAVNVQEEVFQKRDRSI